MSEVLKVVAWLHSENGDVASADFVAMTDGPVPSGYDEPLMPVAQHQRITEALRGEVERLKAGSESLRLVRDEYKRLADEYRGKWTAQLAQQQVPEGWRDAFMKMRNVAAGYSNYCEESASTRRLEREFEAADELYRSISTLAAPAPAPVQQQGVPEGWKLVPEKMLTDAASIEALAFVMGGPEEDDGSPTYCDCVMWVGEIDDDGVKRHGIHVYNTECEEEGSTTLAEFAAAPAPVQLPVGYVHFKAPVLAEPASPWVPVTWGLPEKGEDVQVYCETSGEQMVAFSLGDGRFQFAVDFYGDAIVCRPTHWAPLPPAPESSK